MTIEELRAIKLTQKQYDAISKYEKYLILAKEYKAVPYRVKQALMLLYNEITGFEVEMKHVWNDQWIRYIHRWYKEFNGVNVKVN